MHRRSLLPLAMLAAAACSSNSPASDPRLVVVAQPVSGFTSSPLNAQPSTSPGALTCPPNAPVSCDAGCCETGQTCGDGGGCEEPIGGAAACPPDAPVVCAGPLACEGGVCVAYDSSGHANSFSLAPPSAFVGGLYGTGVSAADAGCEQGLISAPSAGLPAGNSARTIELWVQPKSAASPFSNSGAQPVLRPRRSQSTPHSTSAARST